MNILRVPRLVKKIAFSKNPQSMIVFVTSRCNARCGFCFFWREIEDKQKFELSLEEYEKIAKNYGSLIQLSLTGGEPFLRSDLYDIMRVFYIHTRPMFVTVVTNGTFTRRIEEVITKFGQDFPDTHFRISLSIDAIGEEHDKSREVKNLFEKLVESYKVLARLRSDYKNISVDVNTTFTKYNQDKADFIADWVAENMDVDNHHWTAVRGDPKDKLSKDISIDKYLNLINRMINIKKRNENRPFSFLWRAIWELMVETNYKTLKEKKMVRYCTAGKNLVEIYDNGDIHFCEILNKKVGNIRDFDYDMRRVLQTAESKNLRKWIKDTKCHCTFECANTASIAFNPKTYPLLLYKSVGSAIRGHFVDSQKDDSQKKIQENIVTHQSF